MKQISCLLRIHRCSNDLPCYQGTSPWLYNEFKTNLDFYLKLGVRHERIYHVRWHIEVLLDSNWGCIKENRFSTKRYSYQWDELSFLSEDFCSQRFHLPGLRQIKEMMIPLIPISIPSLEASNKHVIVFVRFTMMDFSEPLAASY